MAFGLRVLTVARGLLPPPSVPPPTPPFPWRLGRIELHAVDFSGELPLLAFVPGRFRDWGPKPYTLLGFGAKV